MDRRAFVSTVGITLTTIGLAGCGSEGPGAEEGDGDGADGDANTPEGTAGDDGDSDATRETETAGGMGTDDGTDGDDGAGADEWAGVETVELDGFTEGWEGVAPGGIEGEQNPTLVLTEGTEYTVTWENADGQPHDFTLWDENEATIDGTDTRQEEGETASLTFEATSDIDQYVCTIHPTTMLGDVDVQSGDDG